MNLADVSAFDAARLASAAAFGWGLVNAFWHAVQAYVTARAMRHLPPIVIHPRDNDDTPPGPPAAAA